MRAVRLGTRGMVSSAKGASKAKAGKKEAETVAPKGFWTLQQQHYSLLEVKKSKFLTTAWPVRTPQAALDLIAAASDASASHNCFAYKIGDEFRSSDDGEPGGTAGRPMLGAIESEGLDHVCVLIVRFFGGTKLGAGGLVRAYGGAARQCLQEAPRVFEAAQVDLEMTVPCDAIGVVFRLLERVKAQRSEETFSEHGDLSVTVSVLESEAQGLVEDVKNASAGRAHAKIIGRGGGRQI